MVGVEKLEVGDVLHGEINGVELRVLGFPTEETVMGTQQMIRLEIIGNTSPAFNHHLSQIMHSRYTVIRDNQIIKAKEEQL